MTGKATYIKTMTGAVGDMRLYKLDPSITDEDHDDKPVTFQHVVVSAANVPFSGPETYIFGCDSQGNNIDFKELRGSFRGGLDHEAALLAAGYEETN